MKEQLNALVHTLSDTQGWFIRCIKPNSRQKSLMLESDIFLQQLRSLGILEAVRIRKMGYSVRRSFKDFASRYHLLLKDKKLTGSLKDRCQLILQTGVPSHSTSWILGSSKVFMKEKLVNLKK